VKRINKPFNNKDQRHGYWESYWSDGKLSFKCVYHNGKRIGYEEWYDYFDGKLTKSYYL